jgi:hypothetical protein
VPVETIKCRECGSADVTEFKPGSYVCGHCEAIVKHVSPAALSGGCEIDGCGVPAIGRCSSCNRRFCRTHQARDMGGERPVVTPTGQWRGHRDTLAIYVDQCAPCRAEQLAREAQEKAAAKVAADSKRQEMLASKDPVMIASAVAATEGYLDPYVLAKAWKDYHRLASPSPQFELVTLTDATRWNNPSEIGREPLWRYTAVILTATIEGPPKTEAFYLDRKGRVARGHGHARPVWEACIVPAGASLRFNRYERGRENGWMGQKGRWNVEAEGAWNSGPMRDDDLASTELLANSICELAGLTHRAWDMSFPCARDHRVGV